MAWINGCKSYSHGFCFHLRCISNQNWNEVEETLVLQIKQTNILLLKASIIKKGAFGDN